MSFDQSYPSDPADTAADRPDIACGHCGQRTTPSCGFCSMPLDLPSVESYLGMTSGVPSSSSGRRPGDDGTGAAARRRFLEAHGVPGYRSGSPDGFLADLGRAEEDAAEAEEDWTAAAARLRAVRHDASRTRSLSDEGAAELTEAERDEFRTHQRYEAARAKLNAALEEYSDSGLSRIDRDRRW